jgi:hypothetical protein
LAGAFSAAFVYKSSLLMAALISNCFGIEQQAFFFLEGIEISEAGDSQKVQNFATRSGSFAPR